MIDRIVQMYDAFMAMPIEVQVITSAGALVVIAATRTIWKIAYPVRWTVASTLRVGAWVLNPRRRRANNNNTTDQNGVDMNTPPVFDLSDKKKTKRTYAYYGGTSAIRLLTIEQMNLLGWAIDRHGIRGNGGLTAERERREDNPHREVVSSSVPAFDFSTEERATSAYEYYASDDVAPTLSQNQIDLILEAIHIYGLAGNGGLTREKNRRIMRQKMAEVEQASQAPVTVETQQRQASMENVA